MIVVNRLILLAMGLSMLATGGVGLLRGLDLWGDANGMVLSSGLVPEISANPWAVQVIAAIASSTAIVAVAVLLANLMPRSRLLCVARSKAGRTQIKTSSLLSALRDDVRHELDVAQVRTNIRGRVRKPRLSVWVVANSTDLPRELLTKLGEGPAVRVRAVVTEPQLPVCVYLRFPSNISARGRSGRAPIA